MHIVVTGSARGIGRAVALKFLACGHKVTGVDILPSSIAETGYRHVICDISADPLPSLENVDILVNNAGVQDSGRDIDVNLKGTIRITEALLTPHIKSIVFIASASATTGAEFPEYAASKGGTVAYMKNVALRVAAWGATANSISPGGVTTQLNRHVMESPSLWDAIMAETPLKKWASPEEIAEWVYFVGAINRSMTAQDLIIDNGESARSNFIW